MSGPNQPQTPGARIALVHTTDRRTRLQPNAMGTVLHVDDAGIVHVEFDTGETLGLILGSDVWRALPARWDVQPMVRNRTSDARRERGRLRKELADLMHDDAPRAEVEAVRARIQQLNAHIQEQDGKR